MTMAVLVLDESLWVKPMLDPSMRVRFWGVRGSIACPGAETIRYGGNTPCIEVRCGKHVLIFDAGTGLRALGNALVKDGKIRDIDIFLTHCHLDHVIGLPFFAPFFTEGYRVRIWAGNLLQPDGIEQVVRKLMSSPLFPVEVEIFKAVIEYNDFQSGDILHPYDDVTLQTAPLDHPDGASGYRLEYKSRSFALLSDTAGFPGKCDRELVSLARNSDLVVYDATFTETEILSRLGWGHSTWLRGIRLANEAGARQLCLFHHDPSHDDDFMDGLAAEANDARPGTITAREGQIIDL
jgi:phosphoribosyl 1,2-cyclic phosphodiesterase